MAQIQSEIDLTLIEDKKIYCLKSKQEIQLSELWTCLKKDQFVFIIMFRRFGCVFCKNSAIELSKIADKLQKHYPEKVNFIGIGVDDSHLSEWRKEGYFKYPLYINKKRTIYKALKMKRPNFLSGYGFCQKSVFRTLKRISTNTRTKEIKTDFGGGDFFQLGGSMLIGNQGNIEFAYFDSYYGDHATEEQIFEAVENCLDI